MSKHAWNTFRQSRKRTRKGNNRDGDAGDPDRLAGEHFLYSLAGNSQLPRDLGLGEAFGDEAAEDVTALGVQLLRQARVPDGPSRTSLSRLKVSWCAGMSAFLSAMRPS
jgi:hypothetical protein